MLTNPILILDEATTVLISNKQRIQEPLKNLRKIKQASNRTQTFHDTKCRCDTCYE